MLVFSLSACPRITLVNATGVQISQHTTPVMPSGMPARSRNEAAPGGRFGRITADRILTQRPAWLRAMGRHLGPRSDNLPSSPTPIVRQLRPIRGRRGGVGAGGAM